MRLSALTVAHICAWIIRTRGLPQFERTEVKPSFGRLAWGRETAPASGRVRTIPSFYPSIRSSRTYNDCVRFEWDPKRAKANLRNHGVSFEEATTALRDDIGVIGHDPDHSLEEDRFVTFGVSTQGRLLVVAHTERRGVIRIISARPAKKSERNIYEEG
ncbi:MAG: BrnT family toxin [Burkholderiales bacterium]